MEYDDIHAERPRIERAIAAYGYAPEHNVDWYQYCRDETDRNIFMESNHGALLTVNSKHGKEYYVFSSPLALPAHRTPLLMEYIDHVFETTGARKVWLELETPLRREFLQALPERFKASAINYSLTWPIMDLAKFDPELPGGGHKAMRKEKHSFYRNHEVIVRDAKTFSDGDGLRGIIDRWIARRPANDKAWAARYYNLIEGRFEGMAEARVFVVDGRPVGINAGWMIPNSGRFYGGVGIHDYSVDDLGLMLYWEDLLWLKERGYHEADMGGTWGKAVDFKNKFGPASWYKTFVFSVMKK
jgi:hypothetical protein